MAVCPFAVSELLLFNSVFSDTISAISTFQKYIDGVSCDQIFGVVIYDLPGRDCAAKASNGELAVGEVARYKSEYIDPIVAIIKANPNVAFAAIIEPDSLPNLVRGSLLPCVRMYLIQFTFRSPTRTLQHAKRLPTATVKVSPMHSSPSISPMSSSTLMPVTVDG